MEKLPSKVLLDTFHSGSKTNTPIKPFRLSTDELYEEWKKCSVVIHIQHFQLSSPSTLTVSFSHICWNFLRNKNK